MTIYYSIVFFMVAFKFQRPLRTWNDDDNAGHQTCGDEFIQVQWKCIVVVVLVRTKTITTFIVLHRFRHVRRGNRQRRRGRRSIGID